MARHRELPEPSEKAVPSSPDRKAYFGVDLSLPERYILPLAGLVPGEDSNARKIGAVAIGLLEQLAEGGIMLPPLIVRKMQDACGKSPEVEEILDLFEKGASRKDGRLCIQIYLDPADEGSLREAARFNGFLKPDGEVNVEAYMNNLWATTWDAGDFHARVPGTRRVLMLPDSYEKLKALTGKDFENGTQLAEQLAEKFGSTSDLFAEAAE